MSIKKINKNTSLNNNSYISLVPEIPFYGVAGTIAKIIEAEESYYKILYNYDGSNREVLVPVPKKKGKNISLLLEDYIKEIEKYLKVTKKEYKDICSNNYKPLFSRIWFYIILIINILAVFMSIPYMFQTKIIGILFATICTVSLYIVLDIYKKDIAIVRYNNDLVSKYKLLERIYNDYKKDKINILKNTYIDDTKKIKINIDNIYNIREIA